MNYNLPLQTVEKINLFAADYPFAELKKAAAALSENYRQNTRTGESFIPQNIFAAAYSATRMPATYAACMRAMSLTAAEFSQLKIDSYLDYGCGTGAAALAAKSIFAPQKTTLFDRERNMLDICEKFLPQTENDYIAGNAKNVSLPAADLVSAAYVLNELPSFKEVEKTVEYLFDRTKKLLIIIDNGTPETSRLLQAARDFATTTLGAYTVAPCKSENCLLAADDWCAFSVRLQRTKLHCMLKDATVPFEDEKFSFFAIAKNPVRHDFARVLRTAKKGAKAVDLTLCRPDGIFESTVTKGQKEIFKTAKKAHNGDNFNPDFQK